MTRSEIIKFLILRTIGNFLVLFAIFGVFATFGPALYYELQFKIAQTRGIKYEVAEPETTQKESPLGELLKKQKAREIVQSGGLASVLSGPKEQVLIPKDTEFSILIPKIGASAKVFVNIDPAKEDEFLPILQKGIAHAKGTSFPGLNSNIYLFAHSADNFWNAGRYNAVFYLLKNLGVGDQIVVFFQDRRYNYSVAETKIIDPSDTSYLVKQQEPKEESLVLQTCWPPGTTWKRFIVIAKPK